MSHVILIGWDYSVKNGHEFTVNGGVWIHYCVGSLIELFKAMLSKPDRTGRFGRFNRKSDQSLVRTGTQNRKYKNRKKKGKTGLNQ